MLGLCLFLALFTKIHIQFVSPLERGSDGDKGWSARPPQSYMVLKGCDDEGTEGASRGLRMCPKWRLVSTRPRWSTEARGSQTSVPQVLMHHHQA
jgi:hypothetical protein